MVSSSEHATFHDLRDSSEWSSCCNSDNKVAVRLGHRRKHSPIRPLKNPGMPTNVVFDGDLFDLNGEQLLLDECGHIEEHSSSSIGPICTEAALVSQGTDLISQRLLKYGIVPLQRKTIHACKATNSVKQAAQEVHRWLFVEGGHFRSVQALMTNYCIFVRDILGIPVDRLFYGGLGLHPKLTAFTWKWEIDEFIFREMPEDIFERRHEIFSPHEPFCVLERGLADFVRIKASNDFIPPDTEKWFRQGKYVDYYALPDIHRSESKGSLAWATKDPNGFTDDHITFFEITLPALTTVLRLHTNDLVLRTLTERMEREIKDRTKQLEEANRQLEQANDRLACQSKKQIEHFACMSHEIRTPLNCIVGMASLLLEKNSDIMTPDVADSIQMIHSSADLLHAVVDDVLDYSKMESGVFEVDIRPTNLQDALSAVLHALQEKAAQQSLKIVASFGPTLPFIVETDPRRLQQILYNLLGNACKFSKRGGQVEFHVSLESDSDSSNNTLCSKVSGHSLRFSIKDYGKGIHEKDFETIFQPFNQAGKETQTVYGGTGLGLSITRALVDRLGGSISVDSKVGEYSEFAVTLPFQGNTIDVPRVMEAFRTTTIIVLGSTEPRNDPFRPCVADLYGLDIVTVNDWAQLKSLLLEYPQEYSKHLMIVAPVDKCNRTQFQEIRDRSNRCTLITHGKAHPPEEASIHWQSLQNVFPTSALVQMIEKNRLVDNTTMKCCGHEIVMTNKDSKLLNFENNAEPISDEEPVLASPLILIAEDNVVNQKVLVRVLKNLGIHNVDIVGDGKEAVDACAQKSYTLVFMDMQMPAMNGLEATKVIKSQKTSLATKVVFCTAHTSDNFREQVYEVGADGFISKPYNVSKIELCLREHIGICL